MVPNICRHRSRGVGGTEEQYDVQVHTTFCLVNIQLSSVSDDIMLVFLTKRKPCL